MQALFDIAGKYLQTPAYNLLGGKVRDSISLSHSIPWGSPEEMAGMAAEKQAAGFGTVKCKVGQGVEKDAAAVRAVREALDGGSNSHRDQRCHSALQFLCLVWCIISIRTCPSVMRQTIDGGAGPCRLETDQAPG